MLFGFDVDTAFAELNALTRQMDGLTGRGLDGRHGLRAFEQTSGEFTEDDDALVWSADLPGVSRENLKVTVENGVLTLEARREVPKQERGTVRYSERRPWELRRSVQLPDSVDTERIDAALTDGVLTLRLPKKAEAQPRSIAIRVS